MEKVLNLWGKLTSGSVNRKILGAALTVAFMTATVKFVGIGKELVVAWKFGTGDDLDAFVIALLIPTLLMNVVAKSLKTALIPIYIRVREEEGKNVAQKLFSGAIAWSLVLLGITTAVILLSAPVYLPGIASGFDEEKLALTFKLLCAIAPYIILRGFIAIWEAVLNAGERFALAALTPIMIPGLTAVFILGFQSWGIFALAAGLVGGAILQILLLGVALKRQGIILLPKWYGFTNHLRQVIKQHSAIITGAFLMCSANLVDQSMAAMLPAGSVAALSYGNRIIALPLSLTTIALGTAVIPYFSKMVAQQDWINIRHTFGHYLKLIFAGTIPLMLLLIVGSELIVQLLFQRGSFTANDTQIVAQIQVFYALQIPFYVAAVFVVKLINSLGISYILAWGSGLNLIINITANYIFMNWIGVKGIALSTSCVYLVSFLFLVFFATRHLNKYYLLTINSSK